MNPASSLLDQYPVPSSQVVDRIVSGEAVLVMPGQRKVKVLNEVGAFIWQHITGEQSIRQIAAALCEAFQVDQQTAEADTCAFIEELRSRSLVRLVSTPPNA